MIPVIPGTMLPLLVEADASGAYIDEIAGLTLLNPRFKGSDRPRRFFGLKAQHTTRSRAPAHDTPAGGEAGDHRCA